jgi:hypothetical protein
MEVKAKTPDDLKRDEQIADYRRKLNAHEWHYTHQQDPEAWLRGRNQRIELQKLQADLDPDFTIWAEYAPLGQ